MAKSSEVRSPNLADTTSTRLLRRASGGDQAAWQTLLDLYGPIVRYWCRRAGLDSADTADAFSETFTSVVRSLPKFERQEGQAKFRAWLKTVTMSKVNNYLNRIAREPPGRGGSTAMMAMGNVAAADGTPDDERDESLARSEETFIVQRTLQLVKQEFREQTWIAFQRTAIDGRNATEIADELGLTAVAVRKAKSRVMQRLKAALGEMDLR